MKLYTQSKPVQCDNFLISEIVPNFKNGDWIVVNDDYLVLYKDKWQTHCALFAAGVVSNFQIKYRSKIKPATLEQSKQAHEQLVRLGYVWKGTRLEKRFRAGKGCHYYFVNQILEVERASETQSNLNQKMWECGNYFEDYRKAQKRADLIIWENLRKFT